MIPGNAEGSWGYKWMFIETEGRDGQETARQMPRGLAGVKVRVCPAVVVPFLPCPFP